MPATAGITVPTELVLSNEFVTPVTDRLAVEKLVVVAEVPVAVV